MSNSCILYLDGSSLKRSKQKTWGVGWGIVALHSNAMHEIGGSYLGGTSAALSIAHEDVALVHGLQYMREQGFKPENTCIYSDDDIMGHAPTYLAQENFLQRKAACVEERLAHAAKRANQVHEIPQMLDDLARVRMHKIKGHQGHIYQERVDYIAKWHAYAGINEDKTFLPFDDWLLGGLIVYAPNPDLQGRIQEPNIGSVVYAPFVNPEY